LSEQQRQQPSHPVSPSEPPLICSPKQALQHDLALAEPVDWIFRLGRGAIGNTIIPGDTSDISASRLHEILDCIACFSVGCGAALAQQPVTKPEEVSGKTAHQASVHQTAALPAASKAHPTRSLSFDEKLERRIAHFDTAGRTIFASVLDLIYEYELPAGIEYADRDSVTRPVNLEFHHQSVREILVAIIQQDPELRVSFTDGLVNIFSRKARQDSSSVLNKVIKDFDAGGQDAVHAGFCDAGMHSDRGSHRSVATSNSKRIREHS
jgi:hypothetical protein